MNANEVDRQPRRRRSLGRSGPVHPNDDVNMCQSSNDVIPAAIHVAAYLLVAESLLPAHDHLESTLRRRAAETQDVVKTGRTHLMDAMPVRLGDSRSAAGRRRSSRRGTRIESHAAPAGRSLPSAAPRSAPASTPTPSSAPGSRPRSPKRTGLPFVEGDGSLCAAGDAGHRRRVQRSAQGVCGRADEDRQRPALMNSGPQAGLAEIVLPALQPGSSIMPGKINPVIAEAVMMVCAQVIGNDVTVTVGAQMGNFELNVMLPVIAHNLLQSIEIPGDASTVLADKAIAGFTVNAEQIADLVDKNPIMVTALNPIIGYDLGGEDRQARLRREAAGQRCRRRDDRSYGRGARSLARSGGSRRWRHQGRRKQWWLTD